MPSVHFHYHALRYLDQWLLHDKEYCEGLNNEDPAIRLDALRRAAAFYRVARNLPQRCDSGSGNIRYQPVLTVLDATKAAHIRAGSLVEDVQRVATAISTHYEGRGMLSLTSKFLWLKFKTPVIVYDAQARRALGTPEGDLGAYVAGWHECYARHASAIEVAVAGLATVSPFCAKPKIATPDYIGKLATQRWFKERVLDMHLWSAGASA